MMEWPTTMTDKLEAQALVQRTARLLDQEDLDGWLALFEADGVYEIASYSPELRLPQSWWRSDAAGLGKILAEVPQHVRDPARRRRVVGAGVVEIEDGRARVESPFAVYRTTPEGETSLYVVGRYEDMLARAADGAWRYRTHRAVLDTRVLDAFTHLPL